MTKMVNIHEAKTQFSRLIARVGEGEEITIAKAGKPVARLVPIGDQIVMRRPGSAKQKILIASDFEAELPKAQRDSFRNALIKS